MNASCMPWSRYWQSFVSSKPRATSARVAYAGDLLSAHGSPFPSCSIAVSARPSVDRPWPAAPPAASSTASSTALSLLCAFPPLVITACILHKLQQPTRAFAAARPQCTTVRSAPLRVAINLLEDPIARGTHRCVLHAARFTSPTKQHSALPTP